MNCTEHHHYVAGYHDVSITVWCGRDNLVMKSDCHLLVYRIFYDDGYSRAASSQLSLVARVHEHYHDIAGISVDCVVGHEKLVIKSKYHLLALLMQHAAHDVSSHVRLEFAIRKKVLEPHEESCRQQLRARKVTSQCQRGTDFLYRNIVHGA